jgi:hypothetical protein
MIQKIEILKGQTITHIIGLEPNSDEVIFKTETKVYRMYHYQDCCETVQIIEVIGDAFDLIGSPILLAEEVISENNENDEIYDHTHTWTFYKLSTIKGSVTIRWLGESNGFYSESVDFIEIDEVEE